MTDPLAFPRGTVTTAAALLMWLTIRGSIYIAIFDKYKFNFQVASGVKSKRDAKMVAIAQLKPGAKKVHARFIVLERCECQT